MRFSFTWQPATGEAADDSRLPKTRTLRRKFYLSLLNMVAAHTIRGIDLMRVYMLGGVLFVALFGAGLVELTPPSPHQAATDDSRVVLIRHAMADQGTDASYVRFGDCTTQRNLSYEGRLEAQQMGAKLRTHGFLITRVIVSPFCRTMETAKLMRLRQMEVSPAFQNIKNDRQDTAMAARLDAAKIIMESWRGPGVLAIVTHSSTIKALTGLDPEDGKFIVYANHRGPTREASANLSQVSF
jgi:phosphohistidine phosphatase SixA